LFVEKEIRERERESRNKKRAILEKFVAQILMLPKCWVFIQGKKKKKKKKIIVD
jgi:hypothetical protein